jgi:hypothetical protein
MTNKMDNLDSPCGIQCGKCEFLGDKCQGCVKSCGKPFWAQDDKACPIYDCCVNDKKLEHCGQCDELPCGTFEKLRDPALSDEEFEKQKQDRVERLKDRG